MVRARFQPLLNPKLPRFARTPWASPPCDVVSSPPARLSRATDEELRAAADGLNGRPRETLWWKTPAEKLAEGQLRATSQAISPEMGACEIRILRSRLVLPFPATYHSPYKKVATRSGNTVWAG
jgi:hypothetical protein